MTTATKTKILVAGAAAVAVLVTGGVAVAATTIPGTTPGHGTAGAATPARHHRDGLGLTRIEHGQFTEKDKAGKQITRDVVNGTVSAVSTTSIAVKDGTGATTTFTVGTHTRVHVKGQTKDTKSTIAAVKTGATVTVLGTGTGPYAADVVAVR